MGKVQESFTVQGRDGDYRVLVEITSGAFSNKLIVNVGGRFILEEKITNFKSRGGVSFTVGDKSLELRWLWNVIIGQAESIVCLDTDEQILWMYKTDRAAKTDVYAKMPAWAWLFVLACAAIPVLSLGGALPVLIGFVSGFTCYNISLNPKQSTITKVAMCFGTTALAWASLIGLALVIARLQGQL
jgi:hypothetical protein